MKKKSIIILCSVAAICAIGLITSHFLIGLLILVMPAAISPRLLDSLVSKLQRSLLIWKNSFRPTQLSRMVLWQPRW